MDHVLDIQNIDRTIAEVAQLYQQMTGQPIEARKPADLPPEKDPVAFVGERLGRLNSMMRDRMQAGGAYPEWMTPAAAPPIDVCEAESTVIVAIDIPGVARDEVSLTVVNDVLVFSAERRSERASTVATPHVQERPIRYQRLIPLPNRVRNDRIDAQLKEGVLTVRLEREAPSVWPPRS